MSYHTKRGFVNDFRSHSYLNIDRSSVKIITSTRFLGVYLAENLSWSLNNSSMIKKGPTASLLTAKAVKSPSSTAHSYHFVERDCREHPKQLNYYLVWKLHCIGLLWNIAINTHTHTRINTFPTSAIFAHHVYHIWTFTFETLAHPTTILHSPELCTGLLVSLT